jgi:hypothetical protein
MSKFDDEKWGADSFRREYEDIAALVRNVLDDPAVIPVKSDNLERLANWLTDNFAFVRAADARREIPKEEEGTR